MFFESAYYITFVCCFLAFFPKPAWIYLVDVTLAMVCITIYTLWKAFKFGLWLKEKNVPQIIPNLVKERHLCRFMTFLWLTTWFVIAFEQMMRFWALKGLMKLGRIHHCLANTADCKSVHLLKSYDKSAHQSQECHGMTHFSPC